MKQLSEEDINPPNTEPGTIDTTPVEQPTSTGFGPVLKNSNFLTLWGGQVFSQLADKIYLVLTIAIVAARFQPAGQSISGWVSAITIAFTIPAVLFGFLAGVFVDRWSKKGVLVITNLLRGGLVLILPPLLWLCGTRTMYGLPVGFVMLLAVTFGVSTLTQFFAPAEQAAIPLIVKRQHLLSANSLYTTTMMAAVIIGFAVGEPLLELADNLFSGWGFGQELVVGGSYVLAGGLLLLIRARETIHPTENAIAQFGGDLKDGLGFLKQQARVRSALIQLTILFCTFAALAVLAVRLAEVIPSLDADQFGFLLSAAGVGMGVGAAGVGYFGDRFTYARLSLVGSTGMAAALVGLSFVTTHLIPALLLIALMGTCAALVGIPMQTIIQAETPEDMRGKVFGLQNNAVNIALSLPLAVAGIAETYFGLPAVLFGLGAIVLLGGFITQGRS
ncbi:MAG: MFS transporter [Cyanobacteriota bacterium]|nr:MFS transporter [Cyanobacteriota bacterium]